MRQMQALLTEFGKIVGIPDVKFDEKGHCCLMFDEVSVNIEVDEKAEQLLLHSSVGSLPANDRLQFCEMLLDANHFHKGTGGATLAADMSTDVVQILHKVPCQGLDLPTFERIAENFVNATELWTEKIRELSPAKKETTSENDRPSGMFL